MMDEDMASKRRMMNGAAVPRPPVRPSSKTDSIAIGLQQLFGSVADEAVPDEFMALLDRIEANERAREATDPPVPPAAAVRGGK